MEPTDTYHELMARLAELPAALTAEQARIGLWHERQLNAAKAAVDRAAEAVREAEAAVVAAGATLEWTGAESRRLWRLLERRVGPLGPSPGPVLTVDPEEDPLRLLREVAELLGKTAPARTAPGWLAPVLIGVGVVVVAGLLTLALVLLVAGR